MFNSVKTGDLMLTSGTTLVSLATSVWIGSDYHHVGVFVWIDGTTYIQGGNAVVIYEYDSTAILCVLHTHKTKNTNLVTSGSNGGLVLQPIHQAINGCSIVYHRSLSVIVPPDTIVSRTQVIVDEYHMYEYGYDLRTLTGVLIGVAMGPEHGFICSHFVIAYYTQVAEYPCGGACSNDLLVLPTRGDASIRPSDFSYTYNKARIFEDCQERVIYAGLKPVQVSLLNPITIIAMIVIMSFIAIVFAVAYAPQIRVLVCQRVYIPVRFALT